MSKFETFVDKTANVSKLLSRLAVSAGSGVVVQSALNAASPTKNPIAFGVRVFAGFAMGSMMGDQASEYMDSHIDDIAEGTKNLATNVSKKRDENKTQKEENSAKKD